MHSAVERDAASFDALQRGDGAIGLLRAQPFVEAQQRPSQPAAQQHPAFPIAFLGKLGGEDVLPPQPLEQPLHLHAHGGPVRNGVLTEELRAHAGADFGQTREAIGVGDGAGIRKVLIRQPREGAVVGVEAFESVGAKIAFGRCARGEQGDAVPDVGQIVANNAGAPAPNCPGSASW